jgi:hypothetical protein
MRDSALMACMLLVIVQLVCNRFCKLSAALAELGRVEGNGKPKVE